MTRRTTVRSPHADIVTELAALLRAAARDASSPADASGPERERTVLRSSGAEEMASAELGAAILRAVRSYAVLGERARRAPGGSLGSGHTAFDRELLDALAREDRWALLRLADVLELPNVYAGLLGPSEVHFVGTCPRGWPTLYRFEPEEGLGEELEGISGRWSPIEDSGNPDHSDVYYCLRYRRPESTEPIIVTLTWLAGENVKVQAQLGKPRPIDPEQLSDLTFVEQKLDSQGEPIAWVYSTEELPLDHDEVRLTLMVTVNDATVSRDLRIAIPSAGSDDDDIQPDDLDTPIPPPTPTVIPDPIVAALPDGDQTVNAVIHELRAALHASNVPSVGSGPTSRRR